MLNLLIWTLVTVGVFYYGIIYENPTIVTLGYALVLLIVLSVAEVIYRMCTIKCHLDIPITMAEQNTPVRVIFKLYNKSILPSGRVDVRLGIRNSLAKRGTRRWFTIAEVAPRESRHDFKVLLYGAGSHEVELIKLRIYSVLGIFSMTKRCKDFGSVLIMPDIYATPIQVSESVRNFLGDADVYDEFRPGHDPGETFEIRQYREKDKLQSIHWKLSAKSQELMVREHSLPKACAVCVFMDLKALENKVMGDSVASFLEVAASVSYRLMDEKVPHFVAWFSKETADVRRIRVDDEESFYLFLTHYLRDGVAQNDKDLREDYRNKYRNEWYLQDITINNHMEIYQNGELMYKLDVKKIKDECEKMELLL